MKDLLTSPKIDTTTSTAAPEAAGFARQLAEAKRRAEAIKQERLALQEGKSAETRAEHYVKFEINGQLVYRRFQGANYYCSRCKDFEKIYYQDGGEIRATPCSCTQKRQQENRLREWEQKLASARLRKKFRKRTFANFKVVADNRIAYEAAWDYAQNFTDYRETGRSLLFLGDVGRGKTHLAAAILQEVLRQGYDGVFVVVIELLNEIRESYENLGKKESDLLKVVKEVDLLVLDDLAAAERFTEWEKGKLYEIINARYEDEKPTIITTNRTISWIEERLGKKVVDRLMEMCGDIIPVTGDSFREKIAEQMRKGIS
jgi:DNA replication protein DnaC